MVLTLGPSTNLRSAIDPSAPGNVVRLLFGLEALVNVGMSFWLIRYPSHALSFLVSSPSQNTPAAQTLTRYTGLVMTMVTVPLLLGIPQTRAGVEARAPAWTMYVAAEVLMISLFYYLSGYGADVTGVKPEVLKWLANQLIVPLVGRTVTLIWKREWLGRYQIFEK